MSVHDHVGDFQPTIGVAWAAPEGVDWHGPVCGVSSVSAAHDWDVVTGPAVRGGMHLSTDSTKRKDVPIVTGVLDYFPDALADVARLSKIGNDKHNPGQPLHWSRGKSDDHADCIGRHMVDRGVIDTDGVLHDTKVAWRALAQLQLAIEKLRAEGVDY